MGITKLRDAADPPSSETKKVTDKEPTRPSPEHPHLDENNNLWENQTTPLRGAPPRRDCPVDAGSSLEYCLLPSTQRPVRVLQAGHKRGRVLQEEPIYFSGYTRLREVPQRRWRQTGCLLPGKQCQVPLLRRGLERGRVLQEEPIYCRLREVQLLQGIHCRLPVLRRGLERGRVLQEEPIYFRLREVQLLQGIHCRLPVLRRGLERGRVLQEEPIYCRLREVQL